MSRPGIAFNAREYDNYLAFAEGKKKIVDLFAVDPNRFSTPKIRSELNGVLREYLQKKIHTAFQLEEQFMRYGYKAAIESGASRFLLLHSPRVPFLLRSR